MAKTAKPLPALDWLEPRMQLSRTLSPLSFAVLLLFVLLWNLLFADLHGARTWVVLVIQLTLETMQHVVDLGEAGFFQRVAGIE